MGEAEGYGYAFIPGGKAGIVVLDPRSKELLNNLTTFQAGVDEPRLELLLENGLVIDHNAEPTPSCCLTESRIRTFGTWLHVTNACNLSCSYCYIHKDGKPMPIETARVYLDKLEETVANHHLGSLVVRFAGGEPTLQNDLVRMLAQEIDLRFKQKGVQTTLVLITNGTLLNQSWVDFIKEQDMRLCISLDGVEEWHNRTRFFRDGKGSFQIVWDNILLCQEAGLQPTVLTTITEKNLDGLKALTHLLVGTDLRFRYGIYRDTDGGYQGYQNFIRKLSVVLHSCYDYYEGAIRSDRVVFRHQLADIRIDANRHLRCCSIGHSGITVGHDGTVYLCQSRMNTTPIGTVWDSTTFLEMLQGQQLMPDLRSKDVRDYSQCNQCQWALTCGGGCPIVNQDTYGTAATASPYCELFKEFIPRLVGLRALSLIRALIRKGGDAACRIL